MTDTTKQKETPRTDEEEFYSRGSGNVVKSDFARQLERELDSLRAEKEALEDLNTNLRHVSRVNDEQARADRQLRKAAEQSLAEQRKDAERYRHIRASYFAGKNPMAYGLGYSPNDPTTELNNRYDAAIDKARSLPIGSPSAEPCERKLGDS